jgi:hypothetical protein
MSSGIMKEKDVTGYKFPEIPQAARDLAAKNIDQARAACSQLFAAARKSQETVKTMLPAGPVAEGFNSVQERAISFAQQNVEAGFSLAGELSQAADLAEVLTIQGKCVQQLQVYATQTQELYSAAR